MQAILSKNLHKPVVTVYHDTRRIKKDSTYPVKIRIYDGRVTKHHTTGISLNEDAFAKIITGKKVTGELLKTKNKLEEKKVQAVQLVDKMDSFTHRDFDKKFKRPVGAATDIFFFYSEKIKELLEEDQIKTAGIYQQASDSFKRYLRNQKLINNLSIKKKQAATQELRDDKTIKLHFRDVDQKWLRRYQKWMTDQNNSVTTVSMYLRTLRTVFNTAIAEKDISREIYPFGDEKANLYSMPTGNNEKKALEKEDLKKLFEYETEDPLINKARDFWFFIYNASGMNVRDIVQLQHHNIAENKISFIRQKTKNTTKREVIIRVPVNTYMKNIIDKYKTNGKYVFDVLNSKMTEGEKIKASDTFVNFINDHMERLAKKCKVNKSTSTYSARHTFGTIAIRNRAPMALIQESFGHQSLVTTQNYFAGFEDSAKQDLSNNLMDFIK